MSLDIAGSTMASCGHATLLASVDIQDLLIQVTFNRISVEKINWKFLVNDVVFHFWVFLLLLAELLPNSLGDFPKRLVPSPPELECFRMLVLKLETSSKSFQTIAWLEMCSSFCVYSGVRSIWATYGLLELCFSSPFGRTLDYGRFTRK